MIPAAIREHTMARHNPTMPLSERAVYQRAFIQVGGIWRHGGLSERFSFSRRLGGAAFFAFPAYFPCVFRECFPVCFPSVFS